MIHINGAPTSSVNTIIKNGDVISHTLHRHEPPVTASPIAIIHEDNDMIVIDKPAGVPVHPAGRYNYNSVVEIMRAERGHGWNPMPCNRLDRLTSGVMFVGKHAKAAEELGRKLKGRTVRKEYVARVRGKFPDGEVLCEQPILQISPILGLNRARANGKDARTVFKRIAYYPSKPKENSKLETTPNITSTEATPAQLPAPSYQKDDDPGYSIVHCLPLTGRTHQIRVHLQFLGHPISNDPIYASRRAFGPLLGCGDNTADKDQTIIEALSAMGKTELADAVAYYDEVVEDYQRKKGEKMTGEKCDVCGTELYSDPGVHELGIFLHAVRYADKGENGEEGKWEYQSNMPQWALPPPGMEGPRECPRWEENGEELKVIGGVGELVEGLGVVDLKGRRREEMEWRDSVRQQEQEAETAAG
jgi:tRNA pseudouridine32 synthase